MVGVMVDDALTRKVRVKRRRVIEGNVWASLGIQAIASFSLALMI